MEESTSVWIGVASANFRAVTQVDPHFDLMLAPLFEVVPLQVVDNGQVVDVATACGNVPVLVALIFFYELLDELLCNISNNSMTLDNM